MRWIDVLTVGWPLVSAVLSLAEPAIRRRWPRLAALLAATGLHVPGVLAAMRRPAAPAAAPLEDGAVEATDAPPPAPKRRRRP